MKFGQTASYNTKVEIKFGNLKNPHFTAAQDLAIKIHFGGSVSDENYNVTISRNIYEPMPVTINSFTQSDHGVGTTDVTYTFNLSMAFIPKNPELQITVPT